MLGEDRLAYSSEVQTQDCSAQEGVLPSPVSDLEIRLSGDDQHQQYLTVSLLLIKTSLYSAYIFQSVFINITSFNILTTWVRQGRYYYAQFKDEITELQRGQMIGLRVYTSGKGRA